MSHCEPIHASKVEVERLKAERDQLRAEARAEVERLRAAAQALVDDLPRCTHESECTRIALYGRRRGEPELCREHATRARRMWGYDAQPADWAPALRALVALLSPAAEGGES